MYWDIGCSVGTGWRKKKNVVSREMVWIRGTRAEAPRRQRTETISRELQIKQSVL